MVSNQLADLEKTGILGSWILRNIFPNLHIEEHFEQSLAHLDFNVGKCYFRKAYHPQVFLFVASLNTFLLMMFDILIKLCVQIEEH